VLSFKRAVGDCAKRRGEHDACDAGVTRGAQHAHRAFACGSDQFVLVFGRMRRHRRRHVQDIAATRCRLRPPSIGFEISGDKRQAIARLGPAFPQHGAHITFAAQVSHGRAYLMACGQQPQNRVAADETGPAGD
jgi:hypothetical protein